MPSSQHTMFFDGYWFHTNLPSIVVYIIVSLFTILSNVLLCVTYWKDPFHELQTVQNYYLLNLGIADLIMGAISEPLLVVTYWDDQNLVYLIHYLSAIISVSCSLLNIIALSVVRYFAVRRPFQTQNIVSGKNVKISIGVIWLISFHYALLPLLGWRETTFQLYLYGLGCVIPTTIFIFSYFMVCRALRKHTNMIARLGEQRRLLLRNAIRNEKAATRTVLLVLIVFLSLWIPFLSIDFVMVQCLHCRTEGFHLARDVTLSLVYFSSGINPLIYAWRIKSFRRAFLRVTRILAISFRWLKPTRKVSEPSTSALNASERKNEIVIDNLMTVKIETLDIGCGSLNHE